MMKYKVLRVIIPILSLSGCSNVTEKQHDDFAVSDGWRIQSSSVVTQSGEELSSGQISGEWFDAKVPSTVLGTLTEHGLYEDAFIGTNYGKTINRDDFSCPWWYVNRFSVPKLKPGQRVTLDFEGISYSAEVWLNGHRLASRDEMTGPFRQFSFDITELISQNNIIAVKLFRAENGDFNIGFVDWNPRAADESMGIFRPVWLRYSDAVSISNPVVRTEVDTEGLDEAWLTAGATLKNLTGSPVKGQFVLDFEGKTFSRPVTLAAGEEKIVSVGPEDAVMLDVKNPRLWWCHNLGSPEMYSMDMSFIVDGKESDRKRVDFGIRSIGSYFTEEGHRGFVLNGKKILIRGAGWTDDIFLRNPDCRNEIELEYVKDMNLNTVRFENVWGTSQNVYDLCDRKGLLALVGWSCFWEWEVYSGTPNDEFGCIRTEEDMELIAESFRDQILWLRNHPSIIAWYSGSDMLPRPELEKKYLDILADIDDRPYVASAKALVSEVTGATGMKMVGPYDYQAPSYWYSPKAPGGAFGFNTETGAGAQIPMKESVMKMIPQDCLWPVGKEWDYHCTTAGEAMHSLDCLKEVMGKRYGKPKNLDEFLIRAHHMDYDGTRAMFEAFRVNAGRATGIIQWMLNSAWPSLYWQLYDWYLAPCPGYWAVKKANMPQQLVYNYEDGKVWLVNNEKEDVCAMTADMELYGADGVLLCRKQAGCGVGAGGSEAVFDVPHTDALAFLFLRLSTGDGKTVADNSYCLSAISDIHDWNRYNWIRTPLAQHADFRPLDSLAECKIEYETSMHGNTAEITLHNGQSSVAFFMSMSILDKDGTEILPSFWSDNLVSLRPGETTTYTCRLPEDRQASSLRLRGWNVRETVLPL